jgi:hypothetical protein
LKREREDFFFINGQMNNKIIKMDTETLKNKLTEAKNNLVMGLSHRKSNIQKKTDLAIEIECMEEKLETDINRWLAEEYEQAKFDEEVHGVQMFDRLIQNGRIPAGAEEWDFMSFKNSRLTGNEKEQEKAKKLRNFRAPFPAFPGEK